MRYNIPLENMPKFAAKIDKLAKRAAKLGLVGPTLQRMSTHMQGFGGLWLEIVEVDIFFGEEIRINGWQFIAKIEHLDAGNIIKSFSEVAPKWQDAEPNCEHCRQNRRRNVTYVLTNGDIDKQVGSTCLKDFAGHADAEAVADYFAQIQDLSAEDEFGYDEDKVYHSHNVNAARYLEYAAMSVRQSGYVSRKKAEFGQFVATADDAIFLLTKKHEHKFPNATDKNVAKAVIAYAKALESTNNFEHNVKVLAEAEYVNYNNVGYLAGALSAHLRNESEKLRGAGKEYVGTIKKRENFTLTLATERKFDGFYGMTYLYTFNDPDGNNVVWFASKDCELEQGTTYTIKGTVKDHKVYNNAPQTVLTRCKVQ